MSELNLTFHLCNTAVSAARALLLSAIILIFCTGRFWAKNLNFYWRNQMFTKSQFLYGNCDFCQQGISPVCQGLLLSHADQPQKKFRFRAMGHFSGLTPVFGRCGPFPNH